jgi:hypothetical protein
MHAEYACVLFRLCLHLQVDEACPDQLSVDSTFDQQEGLWCARIHIFIARPSTGFTCPAIKGRIPQEIPTVVRNIPGHGCTDDQDVANLVALLQCHNNNGRLLPCLL